jgi:MFS family permease
MRRQVPSATAEQRSATLGTYAAAIAIVVGMVVGSITLWFLNPMFWLWVTARLQTTQPSMAPYLLMLLGILATAIASAKMLAMLNRRYAAVMGDNTVNIHLPWARGLGGEHEKKLTKVTVLDVVMTLSVIAAAIALLTWFLIVKPTPPGVGPGGAKG